MRKNMCSDCEITLCEDEYEILHKLGGDRHEFLGTPGSPSWRTPYDLNVIAADL